MVVKYIKTAIKSQGKCTPGRIKSDLAPWGQAEEGRHESEVLQKARTTPQGVINAGGRTQRRRAPRLADGFTVRAERPCCEYG